MAQLIKASIHDQYILGTWSSRGIEVFHSSTKFKPYPTVMTRLNPWNTLYNSNHSFLERAQPTKSLFRRPSLPVAIRNTIESRPSLVRSYRNLKLAHSLKRILIEVKVFQNQSLSTTITPIVTPNLNRQAKYLSPHTILRSKLICLIGPDDDHPWTARCHYQTSLFSLSS